MTKELNIVDQDLKQMSKRQKCSSSSNIANPVNNNSNDNPVLSSNSTKEDLSLSSSSNDTTMVNDTVPNWIQSNGQVSSIEYHW